MTFLSPIALLLLIPWAGVLAWVLMGRPDFRRISTTQFWDRTRVTARTRRGVHRPPLAYVLLLIAMLAGILAASGLGVRDPLRSETVTLIIDRGLVTTAGMVRDQELRFRAVPATFGRVDLILVPDGVIENIGASDTIMYFNAPRATAADTSATLDAIVRRELSRTSQPVRVVTTQTLRISDPRVTVIAPATPVENASIESFAVVDSPKPQAMVRVRNGTAKAQATLRVDSTERAIDLPGKGESKDYFVDLPSVGEYAVATLGIADDLPADNRAYLARVGAWARVEARSALPPSVGKLISIYTAQRPASPTAKSVAILTEPPTPTAGPSIQLAAATGTPQGDVRAVLHPVTRDLDWGALLSGVRIATKPPAGTPLVTVGDQRVLVETSDRSLWVGFDVDAIAQRAEFVILFTRAIDYVAGAAQHYTADPAREPEAGWKRLASSDPDDIDASPGVFATPDGARALTVAPQTTSLAAVSSALEPIGAHIISLRPMLALSALLTGLWGSVRLTRS